MKYLISFVFICFIYGCNSESSFEKEQADIKIFQATFEANKAQFSLIGRAIDSVLIKHIPIGRVDDSLALLPKRIAITNNNWLLNFDSIDEAHKIVRIKPKLDNLRSTCSAISYCYFLKFKRNPETGVRNISYKILGDNWSIEIDKSSPCVDY